MNILGAGEKEVGAEKSSHWGWIVEGFADKSKDFSFYSVRGGESLCGKEIILTAACSTPVGGNHCRVGTIRR